MFSIFKVSRYKWKKNIYVKEAGHIHRGGAAPKIRDRVPVLLLEFPSSHVHYIADKIYWELLLVWNITNESIQHTGREVVRKVIPVLSLTISQC